MHIHVVSLGLSSLEALFFLSSFSLKSCRIYVLCVFSIVGIQSPPSLRGTRGKKSRLPARAADRNTTPGGGATTSSPSNSRANTPPIVTDVSSRVQLTHRTPTPDKPKTNAKPVFATLKLRSVAKANVERDPTKPEFAKIQLHQISPASTVADDVRFFVVVVVANILLLLCGGLSRNRELVFDWRGLLCPPIVVLRQNGVVQQQISKGSCRETCRCFEQPSTFPRFTFRLNQNSVTLVFEW